MTCLVVATMYSNINLQQITIVANYFKLLPISKILVIYPDEDQVELLCSAVDYNYPVMGDIIFELDGDDNNVSI